MSKTVNSFDPKKNDKWRKKLDRHSYHVAREGGTERPFSNQYYDCKIPGTYHCICCHTELFHSGAKYDSGSGWPSFHSPINPENIKEKEDVSHAMRRIEVLCRNCDAHLGHVFPDGPDPTGLRYCINSASLNLEED